MAKVNINTINFSDPRQMIAAAISLNRNAVVARMKEKGYNLSGYNDEQLMNVLLNLNKKYNIVPVINVPVYDIETLRQFKRFYVPANSTGIGKAQDTGDSTGITDGDMQGKLWWEIALAAVSGIASALGVNGGNPPMPPIPPATTEQTIPMTYVWYGLGGLALAIVLYLVFKKKLK